MASPVRGSWKLQPCSCVLIWITDTHRDGKRFVVHADEKLTAFLELERATHKFAVDLIV
jgi:hypothetical protein